MALLRVMLPGMPAEDQPRFAASISRDEPYAPGPDAQPRDDVPRGMLSAGTCAPGRIYPGVAHDYTLYVSAQVDAARPAALLVFQDGARYLGPEANAATVIDNLVAQGALPPAVAVFVQPGAAGPGLPIYGGSDNRSVEYDSLGDTYVRFLLEDLLPEATRGLHISTNPAQRAIVGLSSGGACAFNAAWERPDAFGKVVSHCGSFVDIRGAHQLAPAVRRGRAKALKVFLQTGEHDLNIVFGDWAQANRDLASALAYRGIEHRLEVGCGGHSLRHGGAILPDTLRWLWSENTP
jgi:enterochelin esterase family protein